MEELLGQSFGGYELKEIVGAGGMASIYKGYDDKLSRWVAVKVVPIPAAEGGEELAGVSRSYMPSEEVSDLIQARSNHFPELEEGAEEVAARAGLVTEDLYPGLVRHFERDLGVRVRIARWGHEQGALRRYDPERKELVLSELLPTRSRTFQLAHQLCLLTQDAALERLIAGKARLSSDEARSLWQEVVSDWRWTSAAAEARGLIDQTTPTRDARTDG